MRGLAVILWISTVLVGTGAAVVIFSGPDPSFEAGLDAALTGTQRQQVITDWGGFWLLTFGSVLVATVLAALLWRED